MDQEKKAGAIFTIDDVAWANWLRRVSSKGLPAVAELVTAFSVESRQLVEAMKLAARQRNSILFDQVCQKLKTSATSVGAIRLSKLCTGSELSEKSRHAMQREQIDAIQNEVESVCRELSQRVEALRLQAA